MTTTQTEFEQLFWACWSGESPWEALVDWVIEKLTYWSSVTARVDNYRIWITVRDDGRILFREALGGYESKLYTEESFARHFPMWILKRKLQRN